MNEYKVPSPDDFSKYIVLIRFLRQVHSLMQDINKEAERFNELLGQPHDVLNEHRLDIEDLSSALSDYEDELKRVMTWRLPDQQQNQ